MSNLSEYENNWTTRMGGSIVGEKVILKGKDLLKDLRTNSWFELLLFGITGRKFDQNQVKLFEAIWVISTSYPDPRIWNNRIAALAGTVRSTGSLAIGSATAASEAEIYGQLPMIRVIDFLWRAKARIDNGEDLIEIVFNEIEGNNKIYGFGRPVATGDERINPLMRTAEELGFKDGTFVKLIYEIEKILLRKSPKLGMNVAALDAALCADQGFSPKEFYYFMSLCFSAGIVFCVLDAQGNKEGCFMPLRCERVSYQGVFERAWN